MNIRRRSGVSRTSTAASPKTTGVRRLAIRPPTVSRLAGPLPISLSTGRHSTLGHSGCPTLNKNTTCLTEKLATKQPSYLRPTRNSVSSVASQRSTSSVINRTVVGARTIAANREIATSRTISASQRTTTVSRSGPVPRTPSELVQCKEKLMQLEKELTNKDDALKMSRELSEMLKSSLEINKAKLENTSLERDTLKDAVITLKEKVEEFRVTVEQGEARMQSLCDQLNEKEAMIRVLHNDVVDLRGQIRVAVRVRPMLKSEAEISSANFIEYPAVNEIAVNLGAKSSSKFTFEKVFTPVFTQKTIFDNVQDFILSSLHGFNIGLIAFGQTGSGKTHTMRGGEGDNEGIIPRAASYLFKESKKLEETGWKFQFSLSFLEIYNNEAYDLLNNHAAVKLRLVSNVVSIDGLTEHPLVKLSDMAGLLCIADKNRKTAATKCNEYSSRSHAIYIWNIKAQQESTGISTSSVLKLVDLAGSERAKESGVVGQQFKEMTNINQSLSALQKCISMQKARSQHVPYRDTKLTQVLMDCLGRGNSKTMVVVNINPCNEQATESKRSIEFAAKMRDTHIGSAVQQRDL
uniref:Kinesin-like protein n=1 Tax=Caenorhabditis tropicalis TaxID=1561998 RepID=A0A1I7T343_9PELO